MNEQDKREFYKRFCKGRDLAGFELWSEEPIEVWDWIEEKLKEKEDEVKKEMQDLGEWWYETAPEGYTLIDDQDPEVLTKVKIDDVRFKGFFDCKKVRLFALPVPESNSPEIPDSSISAWDKAFKDEQKDVSKSINNFVLMIKKKAKRICIKCKQEKDLRDFYRQSRPGGYQTVCKQCWKERREGETFTGKEK